MIGATILLNCINCKGAFWMVARPRCRSQSRSPAPVGSPSISAIDYNSHRAIRANVFWMITGLLDCDDSDSAILLDL